MTEKDSRGCPGHALHVLSLLLLCLCLPQYRFLEAVCLQVYMCNFVLEMLFHSGEWQRGVITISGRSKLHSPCPVRKRGLFSVEKGFIRLCGDPTAAALRGRHQKDRDRLPGAARGGRTTDRRCKLKLQTGYQEELSSRGVVRQQSWGPGGLCQRSPSSGVFSSPLDNAPSNLLTAGGWTRHLPRSHPIQITQ